jgi:hypothetical protein
VKKQAMSGRDAAIIILPPPRSIAALQARQGGATAVAPSGSFGIGKGGLDLPAALFWLFVAIPLGWGVYKTLISAIQIF